MSSVNRTYWLPFTIVGTFMAVTGFAVVTYLNTVRLHEAELLVGHSYAIREAANEFISAMRDSETGQRGFLITGNETFLEPFYAGGEQAEIQFSRLQQLVDGDDELLGYVNQLRSAYERQQLHLLRTIELRRANAELRITDDVIALVQSGTGREAMDNARQVAAEILTLEGKRLSESETRTSRLTAVSQSLITIGNFLSVGMIVTVGIAAWTDRMKRDAAELALLNHQAELAAVIDAAFEGIITFCEDLVIRFMNPAAAKIYRVDLNTVIGHSVLDFFPEDQRGFIQTVYADFFRSQDSSVEFEDRTARRSDGSYFPIAGSDVRTRLGTGEFVTMRFRDMSDAKASEARQREYMALLQQINDAILVCDLDGTIRSYNRSASKLLGENEREISGVNIVAALSVAVEEWAKDQNTLFETGLAISQLTWISPAARELIIEQRRSLIRDMAGAATGMLVFLIDVTDRVRQEVKERRVQRLESIGTLAGGIAHDLNNVLTPIMVSVELLQRGSQSPERLLKNIAISADRGSKMIRKLLAFAGGHRPKRAPIDLQEVLSEVRELLTHILPPSIEVRLNREDDLRLIAGDHTELSQVIMNLALNARDAMPGGGRLEIKVENFVVDKYLAEHSDTLKPGPHVLLSVTDTGTGISREIIDRIYDPFFTTKPQGKGTGLGLATTLGIVRSYGGDMTVYSELGSGTKFSLYFPAANQLSEKPAVVEQEREDLAGRGETILLVDDEELILESGRETLESSHYRILTARSGTEAIDLVLRRQGQIDLVLLDMMMPGMDGLQTAVALRQMAPHLNVLASSGLRRPQPSPDSTYEFCGFLPKPYSSEQLLRAIREALEAR